MTGGVLKLGEQMMPGTYLLEVQVIDQLAKRNPRATQTVDFEVIKGP